MRNDGQKTNGDCRLDIGRGGQAGGAPPDYNRLVSEGAVCVYCRKRPVDQRFRPFCSERCRLLDLAAWADGRYRIPGPAASAPGTEEPPAHDDDVTA